MTYKFYIKYGNESCHVVGHLKLKPIDYDAFFKCKGFISALASSVVSIDVVKTQCNDYTATSKSAQEISHKPQARNNH